MKVVLDTNVVISSLLFGGNSRKVYDYCIENMEVFTSGFLLAELEVKLSGKFRIGKKEVSQIIQSIESAFKKIEPRTSLPKVCRDNDDNKVLQLCETVKSNFLITGDNDLLVLIGFKETRIISPALFIKSFISVS